MGARVVTFEGDDWLEVPLTDKAAGWIAAYRLTASAGGLPIASEVRVFPSHRGRRGGGEWSGSTKHVPPGGLRWEAVAGVRPVSHLRANWSLIERHWRRRDGDTATTAPLGATIGTVQHPGRSGHPPIFYAEWAARYVSVCEVDPHPIQRLAAEEIAAGRTERDSYGWEQYINGVIKRCRDWGYLTRPGSGRAGGRLTPKARSALRKGTR